MLVKIKPYIYLSDIESASSKQCLLENDITGILTVDSEPLDTDGYRNCNEHGNSGTENNNDVMFVRLKDDLKTNILEVLPKCFAFIDDHVKKEKNLLVHW